MKYTSLIDNVKSLEWGLSIQEAYLFSWVYSLPSWADKVIIGTDVFYFGSKTKAIEDYPLLTDKPDTIYRYYKSLEQKGLILIKKIDGKDYLSLTDKSKTWGSKSEQSEKNPRQLGKKSEINSEKNPTYKGINFIKELETKNNNESLLDFLNEVTGKNYRTITDKVKGQINARLKEEYTIDDIKTAIVNCSKDSYHIENPKYLTLEFITRPDKLEKYLNASAPQMTVINSATKKVISPGDYYDSDSYEADCKRYNIENPIDYYEYLNKLRCG